ncbi:MAG: hypothetical protein K2I56_09595 [Muribaculaceae bacterium]|nr:hypothetical protein [Muribaculaceae bacterium]
MNRLAILLTALCLALSAAHAADSTLVALEYDRTGLWRIAAEAYDNPAVGQWRLPCGYTSVDAGYSRMAKDYHWKGGAETFTRAGSSTLTGAAQYTNGRRKNMPWCETSDPELLYPYLLADSTGGALSSETYSFCGSYADRRGRWAWGAALGYKATLEYRNVDPRPRNVAGCLDASAGAAFDVAGGYMAGAAVSFRRYTQSNEIEFKSEMGVDKIYHLTGPQTHYARFAGTGLSTHYRGYSYGAGLTLYPRSGHGAFFSAKASQFCFDNILSDLNKLPMASATERSLQLQTGWLFPGSRTLKGVNVSFNTLRRHGRENIFGDATSGVYPQIASIPMYARNASTLSASLMLGTDVGRTRMRLLLTPAYSYSSQLYLSPRYRQRSRMFAPKAEFSASVQATPASLILASAFYSRSMANPQLYGLRLTFARMTGKRLGLTADASFSHGKDYLNSTINNFETTIGLIF